MQLVLRLLCLASIVTGGIKTKTLESLKREILQVSFLSYSVRLCDFGLIIAAAWSAASQPLAPFSGFIGIDENPILEPSEGFASRERGPR